MLFLCGVQLVLRSGVLTVLDLDKVDVTPRFTEVFRSVQSRVGGSTGGWRCYWGASSRLPQLPPATLKNPPPTLVCCFCVFAAMGVTSTKSGRLEVNLSLSGTRGGKSHLGTILLSAVSGIWRFCTIIRSLLPMSMETTHDSKEPVLLTAFKIMLHAKLCLSVIMFLICVCWHPYRNSQTKCQPT